jgi:hypothetical protein
VVIATQPAALMRMTSDAFDGPGGTGIEALEQEILSPAKSRLCAERHIAYGTMIVQQVPN